MKKTLFFMLLVVLSFTTWAQEAFTYETDHYSATSYVSIEDAQVQAERLEAYLGIFNGYFHYDLASLPGKMKVRIYDTKARFDTYVQRLIGETRDDYVYLHYSNPSRSELAGFVDAEKTAPESGIVHQAFVQFLRAFVPNAPLWLREGFGVYFEAVRYDATAKQAQFAENLAWLETYKGLRTAGEDSTIFALEELLTLGADTAREQIKVFYPQAWALVQYLAQGPERDHTRILWDSIAAQNPSATLVDNSSAVKDKAFKWVSLENVEQAMVAYFDTKKTFPELVKDGIDQYNGGNLKSAEASFEAALAAQTSSYVPYYYLGLINYDSGYYAKAEGFYVTALEKGATAALTNYALGVNAFADNRYDDANTFLEATLTLDPAYLEKTEEIKKRMITVAD